MAWRSFSCNSFYELGITRCLVVSALGAAAACAPRYGATTRGPPRDPGEALYRERCGRCHELTPPRAYSGEQWRGVVARMRPEADLTEDEATLLFEWLQRHSHERE